MTSLEIRSPRCGATRTAGVFYLRMGRGTGFGMGYVDPLLQASKDAAVTVSTLQASASLFHAGVASTTFGLIAMLFLANALFGLFESVDRSQARLLVIFVGVGVAIALLNLVNLLTAIQLSRGDGNLSAVNPAQRGGLMLTFLAAYRCGSQVAAFFWGLWLLPFGLLILRSGLVPRVLGVLMTVGCFIYLLLGITGLFFPGYGKIVRQCLIIPTIGEIGTIAWLLLKGIEDRRGAVS
jgi:hypothetical protein